MLCGQNFQDHITVTEMAQTPQVHELCLCFSMLEVDRMFENIIALLI